jgi:hypothetical protein
VSVEDREIAELLERLKGRAADDPFVVSGLATLEGREPAVERVLALGPAWRERLAEDGRRKSAEKAEAKASGRPFVCKHKHLCDSPDTYIVERDGRRRCRRCMAARRAA